jgi:hypothetical protein
MHSKYATTLDEGTFRTYPPAEPIGSFVNLIDETFFIIQHSDDKSSFFMSIISGVEQSLRIASRADLNAERINAKISGLTSSIGICIYYLRTHSLNSSNEKRKTHDKTFKISG